MSTIAGASNSVSVQSASTYSNVDANANSTDSLYNEFITLMVAQVQNQDPLNPSDGTEYVSQLAQFAQVQSSDDMVQMMNNNQIMMDNLQVLTTAGLVGQEVAIRTDSISADGKTNFEGSVELSSPSNTVTIELTDATGNVTSIPLGAQSSGKVDFSINTEELGLTGDYDIAVVVDEGQNYSPSVTINGYINNVSIPSNGGASIVSVDGVGDIPFYEISSFGEKKENTK